jgi:uncharacterized membrane protein
MKTENSILRQQAINSLTGKWGIAIGGCLLTLVISSVISNLPIIGFIASLILTGPLQLGFAKFILSISRNNESKIDQLFEGFNDFNRAMVSYLTMFLFIFLWTLLLLIPGIIAGLSYSMTFFILADDPNISASDALKKSKSLMDGRKMDLFLLSLSFIGWALLCILSLGIGFLWLIPYVNVSLAKFYQDIKGDEETYSSNQGLIDDMV